MAPNMHLVAASFLDVATAAAAATTLTTAFHPHDKLYVSPLGRTPRASLGRGLVVGRFHADVLAAVRAAVEDAGGTVEIDMLEDLGSG